MPGKYYAVKKGRKPGVYQSWAECKAMVDGFPGAVYKSFKTREEAVAFAKAATYTGADAAPKMQNAMKKTMQQEDGAMPSDQHSPRTRHTIPTSGTADFDMLFDLFFHLFDQCCV